jgi:two-component system sensor histidine kinase KdpD
MHSLANLAAIGIERARSQEATERAEVAQQSGEVRAVMLDALAHEFKTPLTSMSAAVAELLSDKSVTGASAELVAVLRDGVDDLHELVSDTVRMLRVDAGRFAVHPQRLLVADLVSATLRRFERRLEGHEVRTAVPATLTLDADPKLLGLALRQLVDNALKYSPPASVIELAATANGTVDLIVRNSGSLISEEERSRVVERFYRGSQARQTPGSGMGLAIVQQIAQAHRGQLKVDSSVQAGTTFTLSLPKELPHP